MRSLDCEIRLHEPPLLPISVDTLEAQRLDVYQSIIARSILGCRPGLIMEGPQGGSRATARLGERAGQNADYLCDWKDRYIA